MKEKD